MMMMTMMMMMMMIVIIMIAILLLEVTLKALNRLPTRSFSMVPEAPRDVSKGPATPLDVRPPAAGDPSRSPPQISK